MCLQWNKTGHKTDRHDLQNLEVISWAHIQMAKITFTPSVSSVFHTGVVYLIFHYFTAFFYRLIYSGMLGLLEEGNFCTGCKEVRENGKEGRKERERKENVGNKERKEVGRRGETKGTGK